MSSDVNDTLVFTSDIHNNLVAACWLTLFSLSMYANVVIRIFNSYILLILLIPFSYFGFLFIKYIEKSNHNYIILNNIGITSNSLNQTINGETIRWDNISNIHYYSNRLYFNLFNSENTHKKVRCLTTLCDAYITPAHYINAGHLFNMTYKMYKAYKSPEAADTFYE